MPIKHHLFLEGSIMANAIKTIGVLTSGGDAPGMNAAIRAVVRSGIAKGLNVKGIYKGYNGLINGEIEDLTARSVSDTISRGGTMLYTARCAEMRTPEGQAQAAKVCRENGQEHRNWLLSASTPSVFRELSTWISPAPSTPSVSIPQSTRQWKPSIRFVILPPPMSAAALSR